MSIEWKAEYEIGISAVDVQHKKLVAILNHFYETLADQKNTQARLQIVEEMVSYSKTHFTSEEALMKKHAYPSLAAHQTLHQKFIEKVQEMKSRLESGRLVLPVEIGNFIKTWLLQHIMQEDKKYATYIQSQQKG